MKKIAIISAALALGAIISQVTAQEQAMIVPEMEKHNLYGMDGREVRPGITIRNVSMATIRMSRVEITEGTSTPNHNHADEEIVMLIEGSVIGYMGDKEFVLDTPGEMITIPAFVQHRYQAQEDSATIEVFGPGRANLGAGGMGGNAAMGAMAGAMAE